MSCRKLAANKIVVDANTTLANHYIYIVGGEVRGVQPIIVDGVEVCGVEFCNGVLTADLDKNLLVETLSIVKSLKASLKEGYKGPVFWLQHVDMAQMTITETTTITEFYL